MKLSDIFKIKTNTGGGNKLFARIMNKYNVPKKEYVKVKDKLENFSGGGDSGSSDVEYWKLNISKILEDNIDIDIFFPYVVSLARFKDNFIMPYQIAINMEKSLDANKPYVAFIPVNFGQWYYSLKDMFVDAPSNPDDYLTPITKEEFYDLNNI